MSTASPCNLNLLLMALIHASVYSFYYISKICSNIAIHDEAVFQLFHVISISGCTDHYAGTESDGFAIIRSVMANLNMQKRSPLQTSGVW